MAGFKFRLQPLLDEKLQKKKEAEDALVARQKELRAEEERLKELRLHEQSQIAKRVRLRGELLSFPLGGNLSGEEIQRRMQYLKALGLEVDAARDAVFSQQMTIDEAREKLAEAQRNLAECSREAEVMNKYRAKLQQRWARDIEQKEALEQDEVGNMLYMKRRSQ